MPRQPKKPMPPPPSVLETRYPAAADSYAPKSELMSRIEALDLYKKLEPELIRALSNDNPRQMIKGTARWAIMRQVQLIERTQSDAVAAQLLNSLLDRAGLKAPEKSVHINVDALTDDELTARLASALHDTLDEAELQKVIDSTAVDVTPSEPKRTTEDPK